MGRRIRHHPVLDRTKKEEADDKQRWMVSNDLKGSPVGIAHEEDECVLNYEFEGDISLIPCTVCGEHLLFDYPPYLTKKSAVAARPGENLLYMIRYGLGLRGIVACCWRCMDISEELMERNNRA